MDGIDDCYEFLRYPGKWSDVSENIKKLKRLLPDQRIHINTVVQPLNFENMPKLLDWCNKLLLPVRLTNLQSPKWLEWRILCDSEKESLIDSVKNQLQYIRLIDSQKVSLEKFYHTINKTEFDPEHRKEFITRMGQTLSLRQIPSDTIIKNFGCLEDLASFII